MVNIPTLSLDYWSRITSIRNNIPLDSLREARLPRLTRNYMHGVLQ